MAFSSQDAQAYQQAVSAYINGSYEEAAGITELLIETRSDDPNLQLLLGHIYCCLQRLDIARQHYQIVLETTSDPELVECVNNSLRGLNQSGSLQETRSAEIASSSPDQVSSTDTLAELNPSPVEVLEVETYDTRNSNSRDLDLDRPDHTIESTQAKSDPVFVDPFSSSFVSSNIQEPASHAGTQPPVDDHLKNYLVDVYDDLGELPDFSLTEITSQSNHESTFTSNTETDTSQLGSKQTNLFAVQNETEEELSKSQHQSSVSSQITSTLPESQLIEPQSKASGVVARLENTSLKTKQLLAAIATGIISATAVMIVSHPKMNTQQGSAPFSLAESGLAAAAAGIASGVASFTLGRMTTKQFEHAAEDIQAKLDAVIQANSEPQATIHKTDEPKPKAGKQEEDSVPGV